jgi:hypothetical protein
VKTLPVCVDRYARSLPQGLNSYPQHAVTAICYNRLRQQAPELDLLARHHVAMASASLDSLSDKAWIPLTLHVAAVLAAIELHGWQKEQAQEAFKKHGEAMLSGLWYRPMFHLLSPSLVVSRFSEKYNKDFRGITTSTKQLSQTSARLHMEFPVNLYPAPYVDAYNGVFQAALEASRATAVVAQTQNVTETSSISLFFWHLA